MWTQIRLRESERLMLLEQFSAQALSASLPQGFIEHASANPPKWPLNHHEASPVTSHSSRVASAPRQQFPFDISYHILLRSTHLAGASVKFGAIDIEHDSRLVSCALAVTLKSFTLSKFKFRTAESKVRQLQLDSKQLMRSCDRCGKDCRLIHGLSPFYSLPRSLNLSWPRFFLWRMTQFSDAHGVRFAR